ncbi:phosphoribosylformylglycinamidine cyclo-ligase [Lentibacillus amyloliquefaciens]|uniref:Phosphoribosylformylglycinamidine cyclo-ligase n=1 Tax=Lentibacillus amyloliquefaciens TaxID=1472767 RepID=A0A0U4FEV0_9BACI|nr:phosphoribosylformylglycinamidine cyclo-ligase [Lentibacillus amyloliquefaciens]ALX49053.1 phosphoribosylaminoimidazole synthetase [Lentibacillus amyloliquefaciens]
MDNKYKSAGVDVEKGYDAVERMKKHIAKTARPEVLGRFGGFGGLFELTSFNYEEPILVSGTDGVGTKLRLAIDLEKHDTVGIDLVAMCVNDIVAQGAQPLFFLDYIACGKNDPAKIEQIVAGIADGCKSAGAALIGGETAEMPGMYDDTDYDLAGFTVGIAEKSRLITGEAVSAGDAVIGLASSGIHSNGYSLVRKLVQDLDLGKTYDGLDGRLGDVLLTPTRIYAKSAGAVMNNVTVKGISHITGGGFYENLPRMMPAGLGVEIDSTSWERPLVFPFLQQLGGMADEEMYGIFNMGIGMALVVAQDDAENVLKILKEQGETASVIGKIVSKEGVHITS